MILQPDSPARAEAKVFENLTNLAGALNPDSIIAVDMPIGLPERASKGGRAPDWAAKEFLGPRKGSVFLVPSRPAVYAYEQGYAQVCTVARETSDPPRAPSIQAYSIFPRIQQLDQMLRQDDALHRRVFEVHPEVSFTIMSGEPILEPKKVKGRIHEPGMRCRKALLEKQGFAVGALERTYHAGRHWTIFMMPALAPGAEHVSSTKKNASFPLSRVSMQKGYKWRSGLKAGAVASVGASLLRSSLFIADVRATLRPACRSLSLCRARFGHSDGPDPKKFAYTFGHYAEIMNHFTDAWALSLHPLYAGL